MSSSLKAKKDSIDMLHIVFYSDSKWLRIVRAAVRGFLQIVGYTHEDSMMVILAVDEAICNVIRHSYENRTDGLIELEMYEEGGKMKFVIKDYGKKGDPNTFNSRNLDDVRPGGLGVYLMKKIMDTVSYDVESSEGTKLTMIKSK